MTSPRCGACTGSQCPLIGNYIRIAFSRLIGLVSALIFLALPLNSFAQTLLVLSDEATAYREVADEVRAGLASVREGKLHIDTVTVTQLASVSTATLNAYELVVTIGMVAAQTAVERERSMQMPPHTLCLLIPQQSFARLTPARTTGRDRRLSAVFIDQPVARQLDLIRLALRNRQRISIILGPSSLGLKDELNEKARERALNLKFAEVGETSGVYGALKQVMPESDVFLALADPVAINSGTVYGLLLTSYRAQVPVVGFSEGLVKAGALLSLFSTSAQQGKQGAEIARRIFANESGLPAPQYPKYFTVQTNANVARSLGIQLEGEAKLTAALNGRSEGTNELVKPRPTGESPPSRGTP